MPTLEENVQIEQLPLTEDSIYKPKNDTSSVPFVYLKQFIQATTSRPSTCKECASPVENNCHLIDIPDFKDMVITIDACTSCFYCQYCIKTGDSIAPKGRKTTFIVKKEDMQREVIKSASCVVEIVEIELELTAGTLGTQFTTIQNLLRMVQQDLVKHVYSIATETGDDQSNLAKFLVKLDKIVKGEEESFTLVFNDPLDNSYIQHEENDKSITFEEYERNQEQTAHALLL